MALFVPRSKPIDYILKPPAPNERYATSFEGLLWRYSWTSVLRSLYWAVASLQRSGNYYFSITVQHYGTYFSTLHSPWANIYDSFLGVDVKTLPRDGSLTETDSGMDSVSKNDGYIVFAEHVHIAQTWTRIPTPYFCVGKESKSESVSSNVNEA